MSTSTQKKETTGATTMVVVDLADMKATNHPNGCLATDCLGCGVAVAIYDPEACVGGLLNFMLPDSNLNREKALANPFLFADTGIPLLFRRAYKLGADKGRIVVRAVGGSDLIDPEKLINLGANNRQSLQDILTTNNVTLNGRHYGKHQGMSLRLYMETGEVLMETSDGEEVEL